MTAIPKDDPPADPRSAPLMDVLIRAGLIGALAVLCYQVFSPFLSLMAWSVILAVTIYPLHQKLAGKIGGKQGLAATILVVVGVVLIFVPTLLLLSSFADSVRTLVNDIRNNTLEVPPPSPSVAEWPAIGPKVHALWTQAHTDLPSLVQSMQPKVGDLARKALGMVASIGGGLLLFLASFIIAGIIMAYGRSGAQATRSIFKRVSGAERGEKLVKLSTATIRAVALGVMGVAFIQAILIGVALLIAGVPAAGILAIIALVLGIAQVPALVVTIPVIIYIWSSGDYGSGAAITHTIILLITGMSDNVLKPLLLGRGVAVPMPVILFGALGGMASHGILGMFVGATFLALGYQIFNDWVAADPEEVVIAKSEPIKPGESVPAT